MPTYSPEELDNAALRDLIVEAETSQEQADNGPYYPDRGITRESLLAQAAKYRGLVERYRAGGSHKAIIAGNV